MLSLFIIGITVNLILLSIYYNKDIVFYELMYIILYHFGYSVLISLLMIMVIIFTVNFLIYLKYNNKLIHKYLLNCLVLFTVNSSTLKILILNLLIFNQYSIKQILILFYYHISFMILYFYEIVDGYKNKYNSMVVYTYRISSFLKCTLSLYWKYMLLRSLFLFFIIFGDEWVYDDFIGHNALQDKIHVIAIFNIITTSIYFYFTRLL